MHLLSPAILQTCKDIYYLLGLVLPVFYSITTLTQRITASQNAILMARMDSPTFIGQQFPGTASELSDFYGNLYLLIVTTATAHSRESMRRFISDSTLSDLEMRCQENCHRFVTYCDSRVDELCYSSRRLYIAKNQAIKLNMFESLSLRVFEISGTQLTAKRLDASKQTSK